jgi:hypothetical protein
MNIVLYLIAPILIIIICIKIIFWAEKKLSKYKKIPFEFKVGDHINLSSFRFNEAEILEIKGDNIIIKIKYKKK